MIQIRVSPEEFVKVLHERVKLTNEILENKAEEYARDGDRMHNFNTAARIKDSSPIETLFDLKLKHDVSVMDLIEDFKEGKEIKKEIVKEKIGDSINYLILLEALFVKFLEKKKGE